MSIHGTAMADPIVIDLGMVNGAHTTLFRNTYPHFPKERIQQCALISFIRQFKHGKIYALDGIRKKYEEFSDDEIASFALKVWQKATSIRMPSFEGFPKQEIAFFHKMGFMHLDVAVLFKKSGDAAKGFRLAITYLPHQGKAARDDLAMKDALLGDTEKDLDDAYEKWIRRMDIFKEVYGLKIDFSPRS